MNGPKVLRKNLLEDIDQILWDAGVAGTIYELFNSDEVKARLKKHYAGALEHIAENHNNGDFNEKEVISEEVFIKKVQTAFKARTASDVLIVAVIYDSENLQELLEVVQKNINETSLDSLDEIACTLANGMLSQYAKGES